jgi:hypothetical protein
MAHGHGDRRVAIPLRTRRLLTVVSVILGIATLVGVVALRSPIASVTPKKAQPRPAAPLAPTPVQAQSNFTE